MVIHDAPLEAVHGHAAGSVRDTVPEVPVEPTDALTGARVAEQTTAAWLTVNVWPPMVIVPVRAVRFGFAPMLNATVPSPDPLPPEVIVSQDAEEDAVHEQPASVSTLTLLLVAAAGTDVLTGLIANVHA
jgi:hypothetical protein